jgi:hypothetical protein
MLIGMDAAAPAGSYKVTAWSYGHPVETKDVTVAASTGATSRRRRPRILASR